MNQEENDNLMNEIGQEIEEAEEEGKEKKDEKISDGKKRKRDEGNTDKEEALKAFLTENDDDELKKDVEKHIEELFSDRNNEEGEDDGVSVCNVSTLHESKSSPSSSKSSKEINMDISNSKDFYYFKNTFQLGFLNHFCQISQDSSLVEQFKNEVPYVASFFNNINETLKVKEINDLEKKEKEKELAKRLKIEPGAYHLLNSINKEIMNHLKKRLVDTLESRGKKTIKKNDLNVTLSTKPALIAKYVINAN